MRSTARPPSNKNSLRRHHPPSAISIMHPASTVAASAHRPYRIVMLRLLLLASAMLSCIYAFSPTTKFHFPATRARRRHHVKGFITSTTSTLSVTPPRSGSLFMSSKDDDSLPTSSLSIVGLAAQPVVWMSLYYVVTTGAGLPAGPFGLFGAMEGISYLVIVGLVGSVLYRNLSKDSDSLSLSTEEKLSCVTLIAGLGVLATLVLQQGCVPNAKPILDYSKYLPICQETPGIFGE